MEQQQLRQTAYKVWISDILNKKVEKEEGEWSPNYVLVDNKKVSRANIIATVVMKYSSEDNSYATLTIDDGSGDVQLKAWREDISVFNDIDIGDTVLVIAKIREYNSEIYLVPEIVRMLKEQEWVEVRKRELTRLYGERTVKTLKESPKKSFIEEKTKETVIEEVVEESPSQSNRQKILNLIEKLDTDEGADILRVIEISNINRENADSIIQQLLKEGEIFEIRTGRLKILK